MSEIAATPKTTSTRISKEFVLICPTICIRMDMVYNTWYIMNLDRLLLAAPGLQRDAVVR